MLNFLKSVAVLALLAGTSAAAHADSFVFSYSYGAVSAQGTLTGTAQKGGGYLITGATGERNGVAITGVVAPTEDCGPDDLLFPKHKLPLDNSGIVLLLANGKKLTLDATDDCGSNLVQESIGSGADRPDPGFKLNVSPTVTPEPSSLMLLGTGLITGAGFLRRKFARG